MSDTPKPHPFWGYLLPPEPYNPTMYQPHMSETQAIREQIAELRRRIEHLEQGYLEKQPAETDDEHLYPPMSP